MKNNILQEAIGLINNSKNMQINVSLRTIEHPDDKVDLHIEDCGQTSAHENCHGLVIECDLPGDQNKNKEYSDFVNQYIDFDLRHPADNQTTSFEIILDGGKKICGTAYEVNSFPIFCALRIVLQDCRIIL